jgi:hypothetical protein
MMDETFFLFQGQSSKQATRGIKDPTNIHVLSSTMMMMIIMMISMSDRERKNQETLFVVLYFSMAVVAAVCIL